MKETEKVSATELERESIKLIETVDKTNDELQKFYVEIAKEEQKDLSDADIEKRANSYKHAAKNIRKAYMKSVSIGDELGARWRDIKKCRKKGIIPAAPANALIDIEEYETDSFAKGLNIYKLLIIGYAGSFFGVLFEMLWCLLNEGFVESRAGLVYGPFNLLYGIGAVAMTVMLYRYRNRSILPSFIGAMFVGSVVEYFCSWAQEVVLGSTSWNYRGMPFNLNGRICLLYSVIWGLLGILWVKNLYPRISELILKIPNRAGKIIAWIIGAFFLFNAAITFAAVLRWSQRVEGIEAASGFWSFIDRLFPNERLEKIFCNMTFK